MAAVNSLVDVEMSSPVLLHGRFFVDHAHPKSITAAFLVLFSLIVLHLFMSHRAPRIIDSKDEFFRFVDLETNTTIDIDIVLSLLETRHRFLDVNCTLARRRPAPRRLELEVIASWKTTFFKRTTVVGSATSNPETIKVEFLNDSNLGTPITILHRPVDDFDTAKTKIALTTDFEGIEGLQFKSIYLNPSAFSMSRASRFLLSILLGYMLTVYVSYLSFDSDALTEVFCLMLGITGVISSNPLAFMRDSGLSDCVLLSVFVTLFRLFCFLQMELLRGRKSSLNMLFLVLSCAFFGLYGTVDAAAAFERGQLYLDIEAELDTVLPTEALLVNLNWAYAAVCGLWALLAFVQGRKWAQARFWVLVGLMATGLAATWFSRIFCITNRAFGDSVLPEMVYAVAHMASAAFVLFFFHSQGGIGYEPIVEGSIGKSIVERSSSGSEHDDFRQND
jgi:hypothetical protein